MRTFRVREGLLTVVRVCPGCHEDVSHVEAPLYGQDALCHGCIQGQRHLLGIVLGVLVVMGVLSPVAWMLFTAARVAGEVSL